MLYEILYYDDAASFTTDARRRYQEVIDGRTATSYDAFWRVEKLDRLDTGRFWVLWSRPAPLRKH